MKKINYYPEKLKMGETIYNRVGFDVTFPDGKKLERGMYQITGEAKYYYITEEKLLNGINNKTIIQWQ